MRSVDVRERLYWAAAALILLLPSNLFSASPLLLLADANSPRIQNDRADHDDLSRMRNTAMVQRFAQNGRLVRIPLNHRHYYIHDVPAAYRYARPWTKLFLARLSRQYHARFGQRLRVTSLVRTEGRQRYLAQVNRNAASAHGVLRSSHLTGATVDVSKRFMSQSEVRWLRNSLYSLQSQGYIYAIEEFGQPVFHIMVYRNYPKYVSSMTSASKRLAKPARKLQARSRTAVRRHPRRSPVGDTSAKAANAAAI
jgi:hypothetical protein